MSWQLPRHEFHWKVVGCEGKPQSARAGYWRELARATSEKGMGRNSSAQAEQLGEQASCYASKNEPRFAMFMLIVNFRKEKVLKPVNLLRYKIFGISCITFDRHQRHNNCCLLIKERYLYLVFPDMFILSLQMPTSMLTTCSIHWSQTSVVR